MKRQVIIAAAIAAIATLSTAAIAAPESYTLDPRHTYPVFEVSHFGFSIQRGRFNKTTGALTLDRAAKSGTIDVTIDVASIDMGIEKWDQHMKSEDFFNAAKFPSITYKSTKLAFDGDKVVAADGELTLLGVTKPVKATITDFVCKPHPMLKKEVCGGNVTASIKRSEYGMAYGLPNIGDDIKILLPVEAIKD